MAESQTLTRTSSPYVSLNEKDKLAVDMAVANIPYKDISKEFGWNYDYVRAMFATGGRLHEAYLEALAAKREAYKEEFKKINDYIKEGAVDAIYTLMQAAKYSNMVGVMAARDLLDRAGFKPEERIDNAEIPSKVTIVVRKHEPKI